MCDLIRSIYRRIESRYTRSNEYRVTTGVRAESIPLHFFPSILYLNASRLNDIDQCLFSVANQIRMPGMRRVRCTYTYNIQEWEEKYEAMV